MFDFTIITPEEIAGFVITAILVIILSIIDVFGG